MIILDTNILSALMTDPANRQVAKWLDDRAPESIWTTSITILEIRFGLEIMSEGQRRQLRLTAFRRLVDEYLEQRILAFDQGAAEAAGTLMARRRHMGKPVDLRDTMIAGIALARRATLATRNVKHFADADIEIVDPWGR